MSQPGKVVVVIVQVIIQPLIRLRQEGILKEEMCGESMIEDSRISCGSSGSARTTKLYRIDGKVRCKFGFSTATTSSLDDGRESTFSFCRFFAPIAVRCDVGRAGDRDVLVIVIKVIVVLRRGDFGEFRCVAAAIVVGQTFGTERAGRSMLLAGDGCV